MNFLLAEGSVLKIKEALFLFFSLYYCYLFFVLCLFFLLLLRYDSKQNNWYEFVVYFSTCHLHPLSYL